MPCNEQGKESKPSMFLTGTWLAMNQKIAKKEPLQNDICSKKHKGHPNSDLAHATIYKYKASIRSEILAYIKSCGRRGAIAHEIAAQLSLPLHTTSARCSELKAKKLVVESGGRMTPFDCRAAVLVAVKG